MTQFVGLAGILLASSAGAAPTKWPGQHASCSDSLVTNAPPRYREVEAAKARARAADRLRPPTPDAPN